MKEKKAKYNYALKHFGSLSEDELRSIVERHVFAVVVLPHLFSGVVYFYGENMHFPQTFVLYIREGLSLSEIADDLLYMLLVVLFLSSGHKAQKRRVENISDKYSEKYRTVVLKIFSDRFRIQFNDILLGGFGPKYFFQVAAKP
jgi:hypothetical protein